MSSTSDRVLARWSDGFFYGATVEGVRGDEIAILFDDGVRQNANAADVVRQGTSAEGAPEVGTRIDVRWRDGKSYPATVLARAGALSQIRWDDGVEKWVGPDRLELPTAPKPSRKPSPWREVTVTSQFDEIFHLESAAGDFALVDRAVLEARAAANGERLDETDISSDAFLDTEDGTAVPFDMAGLGGGGLDVRVSDLGLYGGERQRIWKELTPRRLHTPSGKLLLVGGCGGHRLNVTPGRYRVVVTVLEGEGRAHVVVLLELEARLYPLGEAPAEVIARMDAAMAKLVGVVDRYGALGKLWLEKWPARGGNVSTFPGLPPSYCSFFSRYGTVTLRVGADVAAFESERYAWGGIAGPYALFNVNDADSAEANTSELVETHGLPASLAVVHDGWWGAAADLSGSGYAIDTESPRPDGECPIVALRPAALRIGTFPPPPSHASFVDWLEAEVGRVVALVNARLG